VSPSVGPIWNAAQRWHQYTSSSSSRPVVGIVSRLKLFSGLRHLGPYAALLSQSTAYIRRSEMMVEK
jgi:hypothetical protein